MTSVTYPGPDAPGFPRVQLDVPDGWVPRRHPAAQLVAVDGDESGPFRSNVVVTLSRFAAGGSLDGAAAAAVERMAAAPGYREIHRERSTRGGLPSFRLAASWEDRDAGVVSQTVTLCEVSHDGVRDLVEVTTSSAGDATSPAWAVAQAVQESLRVAAS